MSDKPVAAPLYTLDDLLRIMERLRDPEHGCPWDLKQTFRSIAAYTLEECYELIDAIEQDDLPHVADELGDVLFQVVFYSQLGREVGAFDFPGIVDGIANKLIRRHPHVFADGNIEGVPTVAISSDEVKANWEAIKREERQAKAATGVLDDIPRSLPALPRAQKLQKRAASVGFDWPSPVGVFAKLEEEVAELRDALAVGDKASVGEEMGDVLFTVVNLARQLGLDAEAALRNANSKFEQRVGHMDDAARAQGSSLAGESQEQLEARWQDAKKA